MIAPPLIIERSEIDQAIAAFDQALGIADRSDEKRDRRVSRGVEEARIGDRLDSVASVRTRALLPLALVCVVFRVFLWRVKVRVSEKSE